MEKERKEFYGARTSLNMSLSKSFYQGTIPFPCNGRNCSDISFHSFPTCAVMPGNVRVEPFRHQKEAFLLLHT